VPTRPGTHRLLFAAVALGWILVDQLTKSWAVRRLDGDRTIDVVWTLRFNLAFNSGASFSRGQGMGKWIALVALVIVGLLVWQARKVRSRLAAVALGMIVGGALGNVIDRAFRDGNGGFLGGSVVDFIDFQWWPIFNVADMGVVVGAILLVVASFRAPPEDEPDAADGADATATSTAAASSAAASSAAASTDGPDTPSDDPEEG
jgi:signal peptidase II